MFQAGVTILGMPKTISLIRNNPPILIRNNRKANQNRFFRV